MIVHASERKSRKPEPRLKCDDCGRFIPLRDFEDGSAQRWLASEDTAFSSEAFVTLCRKHASGGRA